MKRSLLVLAIALLARTQTSDEIHVSSRPYSPAGLRSDSTLVQVGVVVRDAKGRAVPGLAQSDFQVTDQGKERPILGFVPETHSAASAATAPETKPRFIALFFDDYGTPTADMIRTKKAASRFVEAGLTPADRVALYNTSEGRLTEYTTDRKLIQAAIAKLAAHPKFSENGLASCPRITPYDAYLIANHVGESVVQSAIQEVRSCTGTPGVTLATPSGNNPPPPSAQMDLERSQIINQAEKTWLQAKAVSQATFDAILGAVTDLSKAPANRMLLLVSSGFLAGTLEPEQDRLVDRALHASVVINALDAKGLFVESVARVFGEPPPQAGLPPQGYLWDAINQVERKEAPSAVLATLAAATGGLFFHHNNDYSFGFRELGALPDVTYMLSFRPEDLAYDGKYHRLRVRLTSSSHAVEARPGYFAPLQAAAPAAENDIRTEFEHQVTTMDQLKDFPATVGIDYGAKAASGATPVKVKVQVDIKSLEFPMRNGRHAQRLAIVAALLDRNNAIVSAREGTLEFNLTDARFESLTQTGVGAVLNLEAPAGTYRLRVVAQEAVKGKMAGLAYAVAVP